jgi:hypothetical protein
METIFNVLQNKIKESIDELLENHFISNNKDSIKIIKNLSYNIVNNSVSIYSIADLISTEPDILLINLKNIPETLKTFKDNDKNPNYFDSLKAFMSQALFNYSLEYLNRKGILERDLDGNIVIKD